MEIDDCRRFYMRGSTQYKEETLKDNRLSNSSTVSMSQCAFLARAVVRIGPSSPTPLPAAHTSPCLIDPPAFRPSSWNESQFLPAAHRQRLDPPHHATKQAPRQMALGPQQPLITGMLDEPPAGLHQTLLQAGQGPTVDPLWQHQSPPLVVQVVGDHAQPEPLPAPEWATKWQLIPANSRLVG